MAQVYHEGERAVQERAGVAAMAVRIGRGIHPTIPVAAAEFLGEQRMVVAAAVDPHGRVWASPLSGPPGFARAMDQNTVEVDAWPAPGDPLGAALRDGGAIGLLAIDLATRRRMRVNGRLEARPNGLRVRTEQVYANCPKYIQARQPGAESPAEGRVPVVTRVATLSAARRAWLGTVDTFFIASSHPEGGTDVSHRGGQPGFVHVVDERRLLFPDYAGNMMFQTLGNLASDPRAALLFLDFTTGDTIHLTGQAQVHWEGPEVTRFAGAQRAVTFTMEDGVEITGGALSWGALVEYSPFNPR